MCRKIATAAITGEHEIEIWGDGEQTRSFMYIDDCVQGIADDPQGRQPASRSTWAAPSWSRSTSWSTSSRRSPASSCERSYKLDAPQGVRGRNSDNTLIIETYGWEPSISLADGLAKTYAWVYDQVKRVASG